MKIIVTRGSGCNKTNLDLFWEDRILHERDIWDRKESRSPQVLKQKVMMFSDLNVKRQKLKEDDNMGTSWFKKSK